MANEIVELTRSPEQEGHRYVYLALVPVVPPVEIGGQAVALTPTTDLSAEILQYGGLSAGEKAALDNGNAIYFIDSVYVPSGQSGAATLAAVRKRYAARSAALVAGYRDRYENTGRRFNA